MKMGSGSDLRMECSGGVASQSLAESGKQIVMALRSRGNSGTRSCQAGSRKVSGL